MGVVAGIARSSSAGMESPLDTEKHMGRLRLKYLSELVASVCTSSNSYVKLPPTEARLAAITHACEKNDWTMLPFYCIDLEPQDLSHA